MANNRRTFLKVSGAAAALSATAVAAANQANTRLSVALVGCGGRGPGVVGGMVGGDVVLTYACDPDEQRRRRAAERFGVPRDRAVADMRKVFEDKTVDAVIIATPDHWHATAGILACDAGKHVYVEKPCSHNFREGALLVEAARRNKAVVQHGTQSRSSRLIADGIQMLREGVIGDVLVAKAWNIQRRGAIGKAKPGKSPPGLDYDLWVGPAPHVPFQSNRFHYTWHWWHAFGTGDMGNDGVHELDYAVWGLDPPGLPARIAGLGGKYAFDDDQQFPDTQTVVFEWPADGESLPRPKQLIFEMRIWSTNAPFGVDNGVEFYGTKGRMVLTKRGKRQVFGDRDRPLPIKGPQEPSQLKTENHQANFVAAIRGTDTPTAEIAVGHRSSALCHLGNISARLGRSLQFDQEKEVIVGDEQANALLGREYREGSHWAVPKRA